MTDQHGIDPRAKADPRNRYATDEEFYASDRTDGGALDEDRPRGGDRDAVKHPWTWGSIALVVFVCLVIIMGIAFFP